MKKKLGKPIEITIINYKRQKKTTKLQTTNQYQLNKRRTLIRRQTEANKEKKQEKETKKKRKQRRENLIDEDVDVGRFFELATTKKTYVNGLNLQEIKNEILEEYTCAFEKIGSMLIDELEQKTNIRFKNFNDFENHINALDNGCYGSDDVIFTGWLYKLNAPEF